jgi:hypothetical protein
VVRLIQAEPQDQSVVRRVLAAERHYSKQAVGAPERRIMRFQTAKMLFYAAIDKGAAQGKRITREKMGKIGKNTFEAAVSENPRKQGIFEIRPYNYLIIEGNAGHVDIPMSLEKSLKNQRDLDAFALGGSLPDYRAPFPGSVEPF